jgi:hypothetical protein
MKKAFMLFIAISILLCSGCGAKRTMISCRVTSDPSGASIDVNGVNIGNTPTTIELRTTKTWVGLVNSPDGWQYGNETYEVTAYPPPHSKEKVVSQTIRIKPSMTPHGCKIFFQLGLEPVYPAQPVQLK